MPAGPGCRQPQLGGPDWRLFRPHRRWSIASGRVVMRIDVQCWRVLLKHHWSTTDRHTSVLLPSAQLYQETNGDGALQATGQ